VCGLPVLSPRMIVVAVAAEGLLVLRMQIWGEYCFVQMACSQHAYTRTYFD